jgi:uncharacterized protein (TIRG00374 family)
VSRENGSRIRRLLRWLIVLAIFIVIVRAVDWPRFFSLVTEVNPWLILLGLVYYPLVILMGALRWHTTLRAWHGKRVHYMDSLKDYWSGLALGIFAPASLGWDVFRVAVATRRYGDVVANSATIVVEKLMALLTCTALVTLLVPFMGIAADNVELQQVIKTTYIVMVGTLSVLLIAFVMTRHDASMRVFHSLSGTLAQWLDRLSQGNDSSTSPKPSLILTFAPLRRPGLLLRVTIFSFLIQLTSAVGNQIFFIAVDYDLPFLVNLFVVPVLYFVFLLPISFGSLGIREGAYILIYGAFGVPMETALLVSFLNLIGILLNTLVGGIILARYPNSLTRQPSPQ